MNIEETDFENKEFTFQKSGFNVLVILNNNYLLLEAHNTNNDNFYSATLCDEEISRISHQNYNSVKNIYEMMENSLTAKKNLISGINTVAFVKFKKKSVCFNFKIGFGGPLIRSLEFDIILIDQILNEEVKNMLQIVKNIKKKLSLIEK